MPLKPQKLEAKIVSLLEDRIHDERTANLFYINAKNWCENVGFLKAAKYFAAEATSEIEHMEGLLHYLNDWNVQPKLKSLAAPQEITGLVDAIEKAYSMEYGLYEKYEDEFLRFERVENKFSQRHDLHAFILLDKIMPSGYAMISDA